MKFFAKKFTSLIICLVLAFCSVVTVSAQGVAEKNIQDKKNADIYKEPQISYLASGQLDEEIKVYNNNAVQNYKTEDGKVHTVYWVKGIEPPKMSSDKKKLGTTGYFQKDETITPKLTNITYQVPVETGKGYFDLNKSIPKEDHMCYLAATENILYWWLQQNKQYIEKYAEGIKNGKFKQTEGLVDITKVDWNNLMTAPNLASWKGNTQQLLRMSSLSNGPFKTNYYSRTDDGYFMDPVFDFFINGYKPIHPLTGTGLAPVNTPDMFEKNIYGGYFYPIFSDKVISQRHNTSKYSYFNNNIKNWILDGKGIALSYYVNYNVAHAITVWGAEFDEAGNLYRVFVTDSDDHMNTVPPDYTTVRGLHGMNIKNVGDATYIGNNEGPAAGDGNLIQMMATISLEQDLWKAVTEDTSPLPKESEIISQPQGRLYAVGATAEPLRVKAEAPKYDKDRGAFLTYQWYKASAIGESGVLIEGATKDTYTPIIGAEEATEYYYCEITNNKYGYKNTVKSSYAKVETANVPLKDAAVPSVSFGSKIENVLQYSKVILKANVTNLSEMGEISYQWYKASNNTDGGYIEKITGATNASYQIPTEAEGISYYFCEVINRDFSESITGLQTRKAKTFIKRVNIQKSSDITANSGSGIKIDYKNQTISEVAPKTTLGDLKKLLNTDNLNVEYFSFTGAPLSDSSLVGTGARAVVTLQSTGEKLNEKTIIVKGDATGDGLVNLSDYKEAVSIALKEKTYSQNEKVFFEANDTNDDQVMDVLDVFESSRKGKN